MAGKQKGRQYKALSVQMVQFYYYFISVSRLRSEYHHPVDKQGLKEQIRCNSISQ